jgi:hypothetical protein
LKEKSIPHRVEIYITKVKTELLDIIKSGKRARTT